MTRAIMIQGAGSNVGKSLIVAGLARACRARGLSVAPFKPQNMSNNAAVTADGGEIGRAQALQARAAGLEPLADMNPVLLKPESDTGAQLVVQGRRRASMRAREYAQVKAGLLPAVLESFRRLGRGRDLLLVEGAGSPAEINLRAGDIANMGFAEAANLPVVLVGDIDRGGVIAQLVGTHAVLSGAERARIRGFVVNKFRGDRALFAQGAAEISRRTGWADLGVLPWFGDAWRLPAEDVLDLEARRPPPGEAPGRTRGLVIAVPRLGRIANFDDLDPLAGEPGVELRLIAPGRALPGDADLVLIPGSKSTIADLADFRRQGWDIDLRAHIRRGGQVLGLCGGYQMLGREIVDADGIEGPPGRVAGLGLLEVTTRMSADKTVTRRRATWLADGARLDGYEIHLGRTDGPDHARGALLRLDDGRLDGATDRSGRVRGCYLHGLFGSDDFRARFLAALGGAGIPRAHEAETEAVLDRLAAHLEAHLDIEALLALAAEV